MDWQDKLRASVDVVPLTIVEGKLRVVVAIRDADPCIGQEALLGGYVRPKEDPDVEATAQRVLREKAGLHGLFIEQLATFSGATRDPRGWSLSVSYFALVPYARLIGCLRRNLRLRPADSPGELAFDHSDIVAAALRRIRGKGAYSILPARLLPETFSLPDLQRTYETVMGAPLDKSSFRRKVMELGLVEEVEGESQEPAGAGRRAKLYRLRPGAGVFERRI